jgi:hypothetical protein
MNLITSGLEPGATYTIWWVIFNNPEKCASSPCAESDLSPTARGATGGAVGIATGQVLRANGRGNFGARLSVGDTTGFLFGPGLLKPWTAEIHLVVRNHGQPLPGKVDEQITTFGGGCDVNTCTDDQFAMHVPFADGFSDRLAAIKRLLDRIALAHSLIP